MKHLGYGDPNTEGKAPRGFRWVLVFLVLWGILILSAIGWGIGQVVVRYIR